MFYLISPLAWQFILGMLPSVFNLSRFDTLKIFDHVVGFYCAGTFVFVIGLFILLLVSIVTI